MELKKRVEGVILGAILGDCVANPYLFMRAEKLQAQRNQIGWDVHAMSDESQLLILGLNTILIRGLRYDSLVGAYQSWVGSHPIDVDHLMCQVFGQSGKLSPGQLWCQAAENDIGNLNSASLLVRQIPLVLASWRLKDEARLLETIDNVTRLTHSDERTREICRMYALTLAMLLRGESRLKIWDALQAQIRFPSTHDCIVNSYYFPPCLDNVDYSANHVTFQRVLYDLWHSHNFVSSIRSCILSGGGTDMNASAVGAILGALWGRDGLPMPWLDALYHQYDTSLDVILKHANQIARRKTPASSSEKHRSEHYQIPRPKRQKNYPKPIASPPYASSSHDAKRISQSLASVSLTKGSAGACPDP